MDGAQCFGLQLIWDLPAFPGFFSIYQLTNWSTAALCTLMLVFLVRKLRMTVSSENFTMCWLGSELTQSLVYDVNKGGLTHPWGTPVLQTAESDSAEISFTR